MNESPNNTGKLVLIVVGIFGVIAMCLFTGLAGFAVGRTTAADSSVTEVVTEVLEVTRLVTETEAVSVEVTREVPVEVQVEVTRIVEGDTGSAPASSSTASNTLLGGLDLTLLEETLELIKTNFNGELPPDAVLIQGMIEGSIEKLDDPYTRYIEPDVAARQREDMGGSVSGIGAFVTANDDGLFEIVAPMPGQPAELAGLRSGDIIVGVDGESVLDREFDEVILLVRGPEGTTVILTVFREGEDEELEFSIVRTRFEVPVVEYEMLPENIAYIRLIEFSRPAEEKMMEALEDLLAQKPDGLILDLRNNPGGYLDQSIAISDLFLAEGVVLFERNSSGLDQTFRAFDGDMAEDIPLVVLINQASASASEIVAGAIQDNGRGVLIGLTSFGKGSVQSVNRTSDGGELRITIARWYTPADKSIDDAGITPDFEVELPDPDESEEDTQLQRAVDYLLNGE